jgi:hypothetical protein
MGSAHETNTHKNFDIFSTNNHGLAFLLFFSAPGLLMNKQTPKSFFCCAHDIHFPTLRTSSNPVLCYEAP